MRSGILCTLLFFVFVYLLRFPEDAFQASASGVTLWFFHVLPSLLPFMILSDFFIHTGLAKNSIRFLGDTAAESIGWAAGSAGFNNISWYSFQ